MDTPHALAILWPPSELEAGKPRESALLLRVEQSDQECIFLIMEVL
jgi:hypothetical protein